MWRKLKNITIGISVICIIITGLTGGAAAGVLAPVLLLACFILYIDKMINDSKKN